MPASIYNRLVKDASKASIDVINRSKKSIDWLRARYNEISKASVRTNLFINEAERKRNIGKIGRMYMFVYDPKGKETLPFYDRFPLVFYVQPPTLRAKLLDSLYDTQVNGVVGNETTRMKITYQLLSSAARFRFFKPCFKHYLFKHMRSKFIYVPPEEWDMTVFLPTEQFKKASKDTVWKDSRSKI
jgi:hypothetical protein